MGILNPRQPKLARGVDMANSKMRGDAPLLLKQASSQTKQQLFLPFRPKCRDEEVDHNHRSRDAQEYPDEVPVKALKDALTVDVLPDPEDLHFQTHLWTSSSFDKLRMTGDSELFRHGEPVEPSITRP
jgi:hypothetical protein